MRIVSPAPLRCWVPGRSYGCIDSRRPFAHSGTFRFAQTRAGLYPEGLEQSLGRIWLAIRSFFSILFHGSLPDDAAGQLGLVRRGAAKPAVATAAPAGPRISDGALQLLSILQRDSRLVDFIMEDIGAYSDEQVGAAVRGLHEQAKESLSRYVKLEPVIDGVEGTFTKPMVADGAAVKFVGNVPAGTPAGGLLRHKGWRAGKIDLPALNPRQNAAIIAPAEIEIE